MTDREQVKALRDRGLSYRAIEREMGWKESRGTRAYRLLNGREAFTGDIRLNHNIQITGCRLSLWKANEGGRSFKSVEALLASHGIECDKGDPSEFEGRYEIWVSVKDRAEAERLLFHDVDGYPVQALDDLKDGTK